MARNQKILLGIKVHFTLNTPDKLRRVIFGLEKYTRDTEVIWKISFQLFERAKPTDDFDDAIVTLDIEVDEALHSKAEKVAQSKSLTPGQCAHALGPAADDAKAAQAGEIEQEEADRTVQNTLKKK
jgi:hypothetical protein